MDLIVAALTAFRCRCCWTAFLLKVFPHEKLPSIQRFVYGYPALLPSNANKFVPASVQDELFLQCCGLYVLRKVSYFLPSNIQCTYDAGALGVPYWPLPQPETPQRSMSVYHVPVPLRPNVLITPRPTLLDLSHSSTSCRKSLVASEMPRVVVV